MDVDIRIAAPRGRLVVEKDVTLVTPGNAVVDKASQNILEQGRLPKMSNKLGAGHSIHCFSVFMSMPSADLYFHFDFDLLDSTSFDIAANFLRWKVCHSGVLVCVCVCVERGRGNAKKRCAAAWTRKSAAWSQPQPPL